MGLHGLTTVVISYLAVAPMDTQAKLSRTIRRRMNAVDWVVSSVGPVVLGPAAWVVVVAPKICGKTSVKRWEGVSGAKMQRATAIRLVLARGRAVYRTSLA
jgi:hypothetical protein